jgi:hypothetical protein
VYTQLNNSETSAVIFFWIFSPWSCLVRYVRSYWKLRVPSKHGLWRFWKAAMGCLVSEPFMRGAVFGWWRNGGDSPGGSSAQFSESLYTFRWLAEIVSQSLFPRAETRVGHLVERPLLFLLLLLLSGFNPNWNAYTKCNKTSKYQISLKMFRSSRVAAFG